MSHKEKIILSKLLDTYEKNLGLTFFKKYGYASVIGKITILQKTVNLFKT